MDCWGSAGSWQKRGKGYELRNKHRRQTMCDPLSRPGGGEVQLEAGITAKKVKSGAGGGVGTSGNPARS